MDDEGNSLLEAQFANSVQMMIPDPPRRRPKKIIIPRRVPTIVISQSRTVHIPTDEESGDFPRDVYEVPKRLIPCQKSPLALYDLVSVVVNSLPLPKALSWDEQDVAGWLADVVGLPEYRECIFKNHINGMRLIRYEDPSLLKEINIRNFEHMLRITDYIRKLYTLEFIVFTRSIALPARKLLTICSWFKSRSGPVWGIRQNWTRCDILRWMKIIMPAPIYRDHWDVVWYQKPEFPKVMFARTSKPTPEGIPRYKPVEREICREFLVPRKFRFQTGIPEEAQLIWMERPPEPPPNVDEDKKPKKRMRLIPKDSRLYPKKVNLAGLRGKDLILARRKMNKEKLMK